jgi:hypothetical protein
MALRYRLAEALTPNVRERLRGIKLGRSVDCTRFLSGHGTRLCAYHLSHSDLSPRFSQTLYSYPAAVGSYVVA